MKLFLANLSSFSPSKLNMSYSRVNRANPLQTFVVIKDGFSNVFWLKFCVQRKRHCEKDIASEFNNIRFMKLTKGWLPFCVKF